jgi:hypothetical protein
VARRPMTYLSAMTPTFRRLLTKGHSKAVRYWLGRAIPPSYQSWRRLIGRKHLRDDDLETQAVAEVSIEVSVGHSAHGRCWAMALGRSGLGWPEFAKGARCLASGRYS